MATKNRQQTTALTAELQNNPAAFEFFQAVRLLLQDSNKSLEKTVSFEASPSLKFPTGDVIEVKPNDAEAKTDWKMTVAFMSLIGSHGMLPPHYTEKVVKQIHNKDKGLLDFLNLLQQRSISLFYQAWEQHHFYAAYERTQNTQQIDDFSKMLYSMTGIGAKSCREHLPTKPENIAYYSGFFANNARSATNLNGLLQSYFGIKVIIQELVGEWLNLGAANCTSLKPDYATSNNRLGVDTCAGTRVWHCGHKFRIKLGPVSHSQLTKLLPNGSWFKTLTDLVSLYVGMEFNFDIQLIVAAKDIKTPQLTRRSPPKLGWNSWLCSSPPTMDKDDIILQRGL